MLSFCAPGRDVVRAVPIDWPWNPGAKVPDAVRCSERTECAWMAVTLATGTRGDPGRGI